MAQQKYIQASNTKNADALIDALLARLTEGARAKVAEDAPVRAKGKQKAAPTRKGVSAKARKQEQFRAFLVERAKRKASNRDLAARIRARDFASKKAALAEVRKHAHPSTVASWEAKVAQAYA